MGLFDLFKKKENEKEHVQANADKQEAMDDFTRDMIKSADLFVSSTSARFSGLDFTIQSLAVIEEALSEAAPYYSGMNETERKKLIHSIGSYVFEVARRNVGGKYFWYDKLDQPILVTGQPEFEVSILAFEKVKGRLENGQEDNIPFYFEGYMERVKNKQPGMIV